MTDSDLLITRTINASPRAVWRAWSDPAHLAEWWCPKPWTTEVRAFDFRPGGAFHTVMRGPDDGISDNPGLFLEIVPEQRIVFTSTLVEGWRPATPWLAMTAVITLEGVDAGTRYTALVMHKDPEDAKQHETMGFHDGWGTCIGQLDELAQRLA